VALMSELPMSSVCLSRNGVSVYTALRLKHLFNITTGPASNSFIKLICFFVDVATIPSSCLEQQCSKLNKDGMRKYTPLTLAMPSSGTYGDFKLGGL